METDLRSITSEIIGSAFYVRNLYGRLMLESFYETVMEIELKNKGFKVDRQVAIDIQHRGVSIPRAYVADMIVNDNVILEFKAVSKMGGEEVRQLLTYLKLTGKKLGFLINFGAKDFVFGKLDNGSNTLDSGLYRFANRL